MNGFQGRENMLHYCTALFSSSKITEFNIQRMSVGLNSTQAVCGFNMLKCINQRRATAAAILKMTHSPGGNCLNFRALPNISFFFGFVVLTLFIHPCLEAPASSSAALTCSQQLWFLNTKEWKKLSMKNTIFSSWAWVNYQGSITEHAAFLFFFSTAQRIVLWTEPKDVLTLTCLFPWQRCLGQYN